MRTETKTIGIYTFDELSEEAKENVVYWLNQDPIEYETDEGIQVKRASIMKGTRH